MRLYKAYRNGRGIGLLSIPLRLLASNGRIHGACRVNSLASNGKARGVCRVSRNGGASKASNTFASNGRARRLLRLWKMPLKNSHHREVKKTG